MVVVIIAIAALLTTSVLSVDELITIGGAVQDGIVAPGTPKVARVDGANGWVTTWNVVKLTATVDAKFSTT